MAENFQDALENMKNKLKGNKILRILLNQGDKTRNHFLFEGFCEILLVILFKFTFWSD